MQFKLNYDEAGKVFASMMVFGEMQRRECRIVETEVTIFAGETFTLKRCVPILRYGEVLVEYIDCYMEIVPDAPPPPAEFLPLPTL